MKPGSQLDIDNHNAKVEQMFQQIKPIIESYEDPVVINTLLITLAACGNQLDMQTEHFKAFVVQELDRLMLVEKTTKGLPS
jgi:hypothetical protein